eukprot:TRINITY_DN3230_c0_g1_i1.p2 TRINITY_DN3230_c0_g1~~TRINITY_DN3230_c0_g1_i1.p2  ORF type:complete len:149 (+),score=60.99 TRINITY_DN3230_c0_g1_i1:153-599(+)
MPLSQRKVVAALSHWSSPTFTALVAGGALLLWGLRGTLFASNIPMGLYCLLLATTVAVAEAYEESAHLFADPITPVDVLGHGLEANMHRGTFYLVSALPIFLTRFGDLPGVLLTLAGLRYLLVVYERHGFDLETGDDAGVPLMRTTYG